MKERILLISGLHSNEACAPEVAREVLRELQNRGRNAELYKVPRGCTLLGVLDGDEGANTQYCIDDTGDIDIDLEGLVGDKILNEEYPGSTVIEFHNYSDRVSNDKLSMKPDLPAAQFRVGDIGPGKSGPYEIGFWQNHPGGGLIGKYCIELPAEYNTVSYECLTRRFRNMGRLKREGHDFPDERRDSTILEYLVQEASIQGSAKKNYLDSQVVDKVLEWILAIANERQE